MTNNDGRVVDDEIAEDVEEYILCKSCYQKDQYPREDVEDQQSAEINMNQQEDGSLQKN